MPGSLLLDAFSSIVGLFGSLGEFGWPVSCPEAEKPAD